MNASCFRSFLSGYIECALWSSNDESTPAGGEPFDANYSPDDIAFGALLSMARDCSAFIKGNSEALDEYVREFSWANAGHDFWLTRNGHGAGFWDRGVGELGRRLTDASKSWGTSDLYLGDDRRIYVV